MMLFSTEGKIPHVTLLGVHGMEYIFNELSKTKTKEELYKIAENLSNEEMIKLYEKLPLGKRKKDFIDTCIDHVNNDKITHHINIDPTWLERFLVKYINPLSEKEFNRYLAISASRANTDDESKHVTGIIIGLISLIVCIKNLDKKEFSFLPDDAFIPEENMLSLLPKNEKLRIASTLDNSITTDIIELDPDTAFKVFEFWQNDNTPDMPSDIFFSKTLPVYDLIMRIPEDKIKKHNPDNQDISSVDIRITIYPDYGKRVDLAMRNNDPDKEFMEIGAISFIESNKTIIVPIGIRSGDDNIGVSKSIALRKTSKDETNFWINTHDSINFGERARLAYKTWYGIQLSILHPMTKTVYRKPRNYDNIGQTHQDMGPINMQKRPKSKYVKYNTITLNLQDILSPKKANNKHCLVWRVIGHWRQYKSGKKIFIQPYWKGPLRDTKNFESREREIVLEENNENNIS